MIWVEPRKKISKNPENVWVINDSPNIPTDVALTGWNVYFTSNGIQYKGLSLRGRALANPPANIVNIDYAPNDDSGSTTTVYTRVINRVTLAVIQDTWSSEAYQTIAFEEAPTGDLLTWLQANAVKQ